LIPVRIVQYRDTFSIDAGKALDHQPKQTGACFVLPRSKIFDYQAALNIRNSSDCGLKSAGDVTAALCQ
jgi:hypothetical protein